METSRADPGTLAIWTMTDGRAGNQAQALGLAEAVARCSPATIVAQEVRPARLAAWLPARLWHLLGRLPGWPETGLARDCPPPAPPWPDLVIGAGRRAAPFVAALGRRHGVRTVQILDPQMDPAAFDLIVAPEHDRLRAPNAISTLGAVGRITPDTVEAAAARLAPRLAYLPSRRVAVLVGGPGKAARWAEGDAERLLDALAALDAEGVGLMVTTSRRTDPALARALSQRLDPARAFVFTGSGENPYPGMLGLATAVIVTADSVNMASEAASTGLPLHVFGVGGMSAKASAFLDALAARGIARDFDGAIGQWSYPPLAEADRVARQVVARLFPGRPVAGA
ncbi:mitochondrial fission ELM1 family protein [Limibaculum sp. M0105]|uniref:Mitochondrial fission ELM1 family protein n=1 Tax=Thermohalobaculum xanthum TaxID=2753746 RepID=A0A8J7M7Z7_9RHOB|nr:mitochondrial fission ELM1 family protein [Thermohalobaculum xanthum]MBK0399405.1 mitochondrial fission ELM1 family protein [Thermohalobaculum xanthum]